MAALHLVASALVRKLHAHQTLEQSNAAANATTTLLTRPLPVTDPILRKARLRSPVNARAETSGTSAWSWDLNSVTPPPEADPLLSTSFLETNILLSRPTKGSTSSSRVRDADADRMFQSSRASATKDIPTSDSSWDGDETRSIPMPPDTTTETRSDVRSRDDLPECDACQGAWIMVTLYLSFNMLYNYFMIVVIKHGGASLMYIIMTLRLPLVQLAFSVRSINDPPDSFGWAEATGLLGILAGMAMYKQGETAPPAELGEVKPGETTRLLQPGEPGYGAIEGEAQPAHVERPMYAFNVWSAALLHGSAGNAGLHHASNVDRRAYHRWQDQQAEARRQAELARAALFRKKTALQQRASYYSKLHSQMQEARRGPRSSVSTSSPFLMPRSLVAAQTTPLQQPQPSPQPPPHQLSQQSQHQQQIQQQLQKDSMFPTATEPISSQPRKLMVASNTARLGGTTSSSSSSSGTLPSTPNPYTASSYGPPPLPLPPAAPPLVQQSSSSFSETLGQPPQSPLLTRPSTPRSVALGSTFFTPHRERLQQAAAAAAAAAAGGGGVGVAPTSTAPGVDHVSVFSLHSSRARGQRFGATSTRSTSSRAADTSQPPDASPESSPNFDLNDSVSGNPPRSPVAGDPPATSQAASSSLADTQSTVPSNPLPTSPPPHLRNGVIYYAGSKKGNTPQRGPAAAQLQALQQNSGSINGTASTADSASSSSTPVNLTPRITAEPTPTLYVATNAPERISEAVGPATVLSGVELVIVAASSRHGSPHLAAQSVSSGEVVNARFSLPPLQTSASAGGGLNTSSSTSPTSSSSLSNMAIGFHASFHERHLLRPSEDTAGVTTESIPESATFSIMPLLSPLDESESRVEASRVPQVTQPDDDAARPPRESREGQDGAEAERDGPHETETESDESSNPFIGSAFESLGSMGLNLADLPTPGDLRREALHAQIESGLDPVVMVEMVVEEAEEPEEETAGDTGNPDTAAAAKKNDQQSTTRP